MTCKDNAFYVVLATLAKTPGWRRPIECLIFIGHFPQKSPMIIGSFAGFDSVLRCYTWPPCSIFTLWLLLFATHCTTLQHTATQCNNTYNIPDVRPWTSMKYEWSPSLLFTSRYMAPHGATLQHTAIHCTILQHTRCSSLNVYVRKQKSFSSSGLDRNIRQHTATQCNTVQHSATHCNTLQHTATHCNILQHTATHCNTLQQTATHCNSTHTISHARPSTCS